jgi:hypothetical protein
MAEVPATIPTGSRELTVIDAETLGALGMTEEQLAASRGVMGLENARPEDFQIPRLQIAQALSPQLLRSKPEYIPGLMVGQFFNTVTQEVYGDSVKVIPVKFSVSRLRFFGGVLECQSKNGIDGGKHAPLCENCDFSKWGSGKEGNGTDCKEYRNWLILDGVQGMPMSLSFKSASLVVSKTWSTLLRTRRLKLSTGQSVPAPAFATVYELRSAEKPGPKGTFYVPVVRVVGPATAEMMKFGADLFRSFRGELVSEVGHDE